jgi:H+/gluconate symporter-like permease
MLGIIGLFIAIATVIYLSYKGWGMIPASIIASLIVIITSGVDIWNAFSVNYATAMKNFAGAYILMFFLGSLFGGVMGESGAAKSISYKLMKVLGKNKAMLIVVLSSAILSYGGVSVFIIVFTAYPIAVVLFREANIPKKIIPGAVLLGAGTFTMTTLPGTPTIQNIIPTKYFGTTTTAAPVMGIIVSIFMLAAGLIYLRWEEKRSAAKGEGFLPGSNDKLLSVEDSETVLEASAAEQLPSWMLSAVPMVAVVGLIFALKGRVDSVFSVIIALTIGIVLCFAFFWKRIGNPLKTINVGATNSMGSLLNTAAIVGFGGVVQHVPAFKTFVDFALGLPFNPLVSAGIAVNIVAGITGSSSGGLTIFMDALAKQYLSTGINPEVLHRVTAIAAGGLDSLPHSGAVVTTMLAMGLTHKDSYKYIGVLCSVIPILGLILAIILASLGIV